MRQFENDRYVKIVNDLRDKYSEYPSTISIETLSLCNAYCSFCPYSKLKRKGSLLPDNIIDKIVEEIKTFPHNLPLNIVLARVNETFLDKRWYDIALKFYNARKNIYFGFFSNGSTINREISSKLNNISSVQYLNISLNYSTKQDFENNSRLNFDKVLQNIRLLHQLKSEGLFRHNVVISRVGTNDAKDAEFSKFIKDNFPLFSVKVAQEATWLCDVSGTQGDNGYKDLPCRQWFQVHILSDGREAFCCIDAEGQYSSGNIYDDSIIHMYNHPVKLKARMARSRAQVVLCKECVMVP